MPAPVHFKFEDDSIRTEFFPSTTTACAPEAVPVVPVTDMSPVEYIKGLPAPSVDKVHPVQETTPSPLSVANVAQEPPVEDIVTFVADITRYYTSICCM